MLEYQSMYIIITEPLQTDIASFQSVQSVIPAELAQLVSYFHLQVTRNFLPENIFNVTFLKIKQLSSDFLNKV